MSRLCYLITLWVVLMAVGCSASTPGSPRHANSIGYIDNNHSLHHSYITSQYDPNRVRHGDCHAFTNSNPHSTHADRQRRRGL